MSFREMMKRAREGAEEGDWSPKPGTHEALVVDGDAFEAASGVTYAKTRLRLVKSGHPDDGREWDHLMGLPDDNPRQAAMSVSQLSLYGIDGDAFDAMDDVDDLAAAMAELEGVTVTVTCKSRQTGDGVWTNVQGSRNPRKSDVPADQESFALDTAAGNGAGADVDDDDVPF